MSNKLLSALVGSVTVFAGVSVIAEIIQGIDVETNLFGLLYCVGIVVMCRRLASR